MFDEPRRHRVFLLLLVLAMIGTVPLPFVGGQPFLVFGLPAWLLWSLGFTAAMAALSTYGILYFWKDEEAEDEGEDGEGLEGSA